MTNFWKNTSRYWQDDVTCLVGVWLVISPWVLGFVGTPAAFWNAIVVGAVIIVLTLAALMQFQEWEEWVDMVIGAWLIASPWVLGFAALSAGAATGSVAATWNFILAGLVTIILSGWSVQHHRDTASGAH